MKIFQLSKPFVKSSLSAHSVIGITVGALMYIICLTGTLLVFAEYLHRIESPNTPEFEKYDHHVVSRAVESFLTEVKTPEKPIYVVFPTEQLPRMHISDGDNEWNLDETGQLVAPGKEEWSHLIEDLHVALHLPQTIGLIVVSILGAMLVGLIISGVFAHPRILKDAFKLRLGGQERLENIDLHNRLSVWGLPFHLMIGITGAFFGLVGLLVLVASAAFYNGDREALLADFYGPDIEVNAPVQTVDFEKALQHFNEQHNAATPIYLILHHANTEQQYIEIAATHPGRLIYSEIYRYGADGQYIDHQQMSDGPIGRQIAYSIYRLHFGWFGGTGVRWLYVILGLSLCVISVSGINIWLIKRQKDDWIFHAWPAIVWGFPCGLALAYCGSSLLAIAPGLSLLVCQVLCVLFALYLKNTTKLRLYLRATLGASLAAMLVSYLAI